MVTISPIPKSHLKTYFLLILTNLVWGSTWVVGKLLTTEVAPITASAMRFVLASLALAAVLMWREGRIPRLVRADWRAAFFMGLTGIFLYAVFFLVGLRHTSAGRGALIIALNPAVTALAAWLLFRDAMSPLKGFGIALALMGCLWVVGNGHPMNLFHGEVGWGDVLIMGCVLMWAVYSFVPRMASGQTSALVMNFYSCLVGAVLLSIASLFERSWQIVPQVSMHAWLYVGYLAVFATTLSYTWYLNAVNVLGAGRTAIFTNITPLSGVIMGALYLHERLPIAVLAGGMVTILGVALTIWADMRAKARVSSVATE